MPNRADSTNLALALAVMALSPAVGLAQETTEEETAEPDVRVVAHQRFVALLNPMGAEHRLDVAVRTQLGDQDDILFDGAHLETGATSAVSPVYALGGGYAELAPFSFLVLRADVVGGGIWPIGMNGAGYFPVGGYDAAVQVLPADEGRSTTGWLATFSGTLQGAVDLWSGARLLLVSELGVTHAVVGDAPFYYSMTHDMVLRREDTLLTNGSFLGLEVRAASDLLVRVGAYDDLRYVPESGYLGLQVGGLAMLEWQRVDSRVGALGIFVRGGGYTHHAFRAEQATVLGGIYVDYELGGL